MFSSSKCTTPEGKPAEGTAIARDLHNAPVAYDSSRMEIRLLRETRSVFEYLRRHLPDVSGGPYSQIKKVLQFSKDSGTKT